MLLEDIFDESVVYTNFLIDNVIERQSIEGIGKLCNDISMHYRVLGICELLIDGDTDEFFHSLIQSALTRKYYLKRCADENYLKDPARRTSFIDPFLDAVAANQFNLANEIGSLSPDQWWEGYEYEDDFAYASFLNKFVAFNNNINNKLMIAITQFENALEGGKAVRLDLCKALFNKDQNNFEKIFTELIYDHERYMGEKAVTSFSYDYTFEPNKRMFIEGLAILRIVERLGFKTKAEYKYCPRIARISDYKTFIPNSFPNLNL